MGEIRIVGPGKTHGYHYPVCKKSNSVSFTFSSFLIGELLLKERICCSRSWSIPLVDPSLEGSVVLKQMGCSTAL